MTVYQLKIQVPTVRVETKVPTAPNKVIQTARHCCKSSLRLINVPKWTNNSPMQIELKLVSKEAEAIIFLGKIVQKPKTNKTAVTKTDGI